MKQPRKQVYFAKSSIDKDLLEFIEMQSNLSKSVTLGMQVLFEIFGKIDLKDYIPVGFEAHDTPVTYEKLMKLAHNNGLVPSANKPGLKYELRDEQTANTNQLNQELISKLLNLSPEALQGIEAILNLNTQAPVPASSDNVDKTNGPVIIDEIPSSSTPSNVSSSVDKEGEGINESPQSNTAYETKPNDDGEKKDTAPEAGAWSGIEDFDM